MMPIWSDREEALFWSKTSLQKGSILVLIGDLPMKCLTCPGDLVTDFNEGVEVDLCESCGGCWLDSGELKQIVDIRENTFNAEEVSLVRGINEQVFHDKEDKQKELACPKCGELMNRFNYASTTGILIDKCSEHGIWFDQNELEHVQICVEEWEKKAGEDNAKYAPILAKIRHETEERNKKAMTHSKLSRKSPIPRFILESFL